MEVFSFGWSTLVMPISFRYASPPNWCSVGTWFFHPKRPTRTHRSLGMEIMATCFVALPLVIREVVPVLEEVGTEEEDAARTLGASARCVGLLGAVQREPVVAGGDPLRELVAVVRMRPRPAMRVLARQAEAERERRPADDLSIVSERRGQVHFFVRCSLRHWR